MVPGGVALRQLAQGEGAESGQKGAQNKPAACRRDLAGRQRGVRCQEDEEAIAHGVH